MIRKLILVCGLIVVFAATTIAATVTWDGGDDSDPKWSTGLNWDGDNPPSSGTDVNLLFAGSTGMSPVNDLDSYTFGTITLNPSAGAFTLGGLGVTLFAGITNSAGANLVNVSGIASSANMAFTNNDAGDMLTIFDNPASGKTIGLNGDLNVNGAGDVVVNGAVNGGGMINKTGAGTLKLNVANGYTGGTQISAGTLELGASDILPDDGNVQISGGVLDIGANNDAVATVFLTEDTSRISGTTGVLNASTFELNKGQVSAILGGGGSLVVAASDGTVTLSGANTYTGETTVNAGSLVLSGASGALYSGGASEPSAVAIAAGACVVLDNQAADKADRLGDTVPVKLDGGTFSFIGNGSADSGESTGTLSLLGGYSTVSVANGAGYSATITADSLAAPFGTTVDFVGTGLGGASMSPHVKFNMFPDLQSGIIPFATVNNYDFATYDATDGIQAYSGYVATIAGAAETDNVKIAASESVGSEKIINSLVIDGDYTVSGAGTLGLVAGGIICKGADTISVASLAFAADEGVVFVHGTTTISSAIAGDCFTKSGTGTLTLSGANAYTGITTIDAGSLVLGASGAIPDGSPVSVHGSATLDLAGYSDSIGALSGGGTVQLGAGGQLAMQLGEETATFSGMITGDGSVAMTGIGTQVFANSSDYTGGTTVSGGTLTYGISSALWNSGDITVNGGVLDVGAFDVAAGDVALTDGAIRGDPGQSSLTASTVYLENGTVDVRITGGTNVEKITAGTTATLTAACDYSGTTTITAGTLAGPANNFPGTDILNQDVLVFDQADGSGWYDGAITGSGALVVTGENDLGLGGTNEYTGGTTVLGAWLYLNADDVIPDTGTIVIDQGGTLDVNGYFDTVGPVTLVNGTLTDYGDDWGELTADSYAVQSGTVEAALAGPGGLTKTGADTVTMSGPCSYLGETRVNEGTLQLNGSDVLPDAGTLRVSGGTFDLCSNSDTVGTVVLESGEIADNDGGGQLSASAAFDVRSGTIGASLSGDAALTKTTADPVFLTGANSYAGGTLVSAGTLVGNGASLPGGITNNALVIFDEDGDRAYGGSMTGSGSVIKTNNGTITFSGANSFAGPTSINGGTLIVTNSNTSDMLVNDEGTLMGTGATGDLVINIGGTVSPGTPGVSLGIGELTVADATLAGNGSLVLQLRDATGGAGTGWDELIVTGTNGLDITATSVSTFAITLVSLDADGNVGDCSNFNNTINQSFAIITTTNGITGFSADKFAPVGIAQFTNGLGGGNFSIGQSGDNLVLEFNAVPEPSAAALFILAVPVVFAASRIRRKRELKG